MSQQNEPPDLKRQFDFLLKDYELKTRYLTDHLQRMWTRFNFFVTIESALISGKFLFQSGIPNPQLIWAGVILSMVWYIFGVQDRFLVEIYRTQAQKAAYYAQALGRSDNNKQVAYIPIGEIKETAKAVRKNQKLWDIVTAWRWEPISITRLAALVPVLVLLLWVILSITVIG